MNKGPMLWIVSCIDKPNSAGLRQDLRAAHRKYLDAMKEQVFFTARQESDDGAAAICRWLCCWHAACPCVGADRMSWLLGGPWSPIGWG